VAEINPIQLQKYLKGVNYPASKDDLVRQAESQGADETVRRALNNLDEQQFQNPAEVSKALSKAKR
jgi:hypothetical protein